MFGTLKHLFKLDRHIEDLFKPFDFLGLRLKNRIAMSSMSRLRTGENSTPLPINKTYYNQRSNAGLIFSETLSVSQQGLPSEFSQGLWSKQQVEKWKEIIDELHNNDSIVFAQLTHGGPITHESFNGNHQPMSPSGINLKSNVMTKNGLVETQNPKIMTKDDFNRVFDEFASAAINAQKAGFDGIQLHATSGYLLDNILRLQAHPENSDICNKFVLDLLIELKKTFGDTVGIKIAPTCTLNNVFNKDPLQLCTKLAQTLHKNDIKFVEVKYGEENNKNIYRESPTMQIPVPHREFKKFYEHKIIAHMKTLREAYSAFLNDNAEMISLDNHWISNPDLVERLQNNYSLLDANPEYLNTQDEKGFIDYPIIHK